jgi:hypothetical protein
VRISPLTDTAAVLACRDALVVQLRQLVGSLADMPPVSQVRPLQLFDVTNRPAQALQQALAQLPRAGEFGQVDVRSYFDKGLPTYEQRWRDVGRAALGLEIYVEPLRHIPDRNSWPALRDLTDLAAALPALDHDLAEAILPCLKGGEDLAVPYEMLTHPGTTQSGSARPRSATGFRPVRQQRRPRRRSRRRSAAVSWTRRWTATSGRC